MAFPKFASVSSLSLAGIVLLVGGLSIAIFASQNQQDTRSRASTDSTCMNGSNLLPGGASCGKPSDPNRNSMCCSNSCSGGNFAFYGTCDAEPKPQCVSEGGTCKSSGTINEVAEDGKGCVSGTKCYKIKKSACENAGGTCIGVSSQGVGGCPAGQPANTVKSGYYLDTSKSCNSDYKICCRPQATGGTAPFNCNDTSTKDRTCRYNTGCDSSAGESIVPNGSCGSSSMVCCEKNKTTQTPPNQNPAPQTPASTTECGSAGCCSTAFPGGKCQYTSNACAGGYATNYCPGGTNYKCCKPAAPVTTASACGDTSAPTGTVISKGAQTSASAEYQGNTSGMVVDGNTGTSWNSGNYPQQWIEINLGSKKTVTGLKLHVNQDPNGHTIHQIYAGPTSNPSTLVRTLDCTTVNDEVINVVFAQPLTDTQYIRINTPTGVSWVAWKEIEVYSGESSGGTTFNLNLLLHGIGKAGDNANANGGGNTDLKTPIRNVLVSVYDLDNQPVVSNKQGEVTFDPDFGGFKGSVGLGTTLPDQAYVIKVKMSDSLWGKVSRNVTSGSNDIPTMKLVNGDVNGDGQADNNDYKIIVGCYSDFGQPAKDCDDTRKSEADLDDDGNVNQFDLNLYLREMSVQQ